MTKILIAEDDPQVAALLERGLSANGFETTTVDDGAAVGDTLEKDVPHLLILDLAPPNPEGLDFRRALRRQGSRLPVVILSANQALRVKLAGFELGADDYVTKPFMFDELLARVKARLRGAAKAGRMLAVGGIALDLETRWATFEDRRGELSPPGVAPPGNFIRPPPEGPTRGMLLSPGWGDHFD